MLSLAATTLSQWQATMVAALAHSPSIWAVTVAAFCSSRLPMDWAAKTSPPPELIRTVISLTGPRAASSSANCFAVTSSLYQLYCAMSPYSISSALWPPAMLRNCQKCLFAVFAVSGVAVPAAAIATA